MACATAQHNELRCHLLTMGSNMQVAYAMGERNVMSSLSHPYLVNLRFAFQTNHRLFLVMDYIEVRCVCCCHPVCGGSHQTVLNEADYQYFN